MQPVPKLRLLHADWMDFTDCKGPFCQCASLVKDNHLSMCQSFQVVASLYKNADLGCAANAAEETKRNGDDQRTRTGDNQESQGTVNPGAKRLPGNEWRQDCQRQSSKYHHGGVISGEACDKILDPAFLSLAFSTRSRIFATVDSPNSFVVWMVRIPV